MTDLEIIGAMLIARQLGEVRDSEWQKHGVPLKVLDSLGQERTIEQSLMMPAIRLTADDNVVEFRFDDAGRLVQVFGYNDAEY